MTFVQCKRKQVHHQFGQCRYIQDLCSKIQEILTSDNIENQLSYINISFEVRDKNKLKNLVFNFIALLVKFYIFSSKYKSVQRPNINYCNKHYKKKNILHFPKIT